MKKIVTICLMIFLSTVVFAQYQMSETKTDWKERVHIGGGLGLSFGNTTHVELSPRISYNLTTRLSAGVGGTYMYYKNNTYDFKTQMYGFVSFADFVLIKSLNNILPVSNGFGSIVIHAEADCLNLDPNMDFNSFPARTQRFWLWQPMIGIGFKIPAGKRSYGMILIQYNLNEKLYSPYTNPVINVYLMF